MYNKISLGVGIGASLVLVGIIIAAVLARAAPMVPAVGTDMNCPAIVAGWPDTLGSSDGITMSCFPAPLTPSSPQVFGTRITTDATGLYAWTFPAGCLNGGNVPYFSAIAEGPSPQNGITVNPQVEGTPTATTVSIRVTSVVATTVALLGLTILSVPAQGARVLDLTCAPR